MEQIHYIYKITFLKGKLKGHYYIGKRTSPVRIKKLEWSGYDTINELALHDSMFDNYTGSGRIPRDYFKKYGKIHKETFLKEIICISKTFEENSLTEEKIIGEKYRTDPLCTNLVKGGMCGDPSKISGKASPTYGRVLTKEEKEHLSKINKERFKNANVPWKGKKKTNEEKRQISESLKEFYKTHQHPFKGKKHTKESNESNSKSHKELWKDERYRKKVSESIKKFHKEHVGIWKGKKVSEETKKKLSDIFKGKPNPKNMGIKNGMYGKTPPNIRPVIQMDKNGKIIKEWSSIKEAGKSLGLCSANICNVCNGKRHSCGGFSWTYVK